MENKMINKGITKMVRAEELVLLGRTKKTTDGKTIYNMGGDLILIDNNGRVERILDAKVCMTKKGIHVEDLKSELIDEGISEDKK